MQAPGPPSSDAQHDAAPALLPAAVWAHVLSLLDARARGACAQASRALRDAAAAATNSIELDMAASTAAARHARTASLRRYLEAHGGDSSSQLRLTRLAVSGACMSRPHMQLVLGPGLAQLRHLDVTSCRLALSAPPPGAAGAEAPAGPHAGGGVATPAPAPAAALLLTSLRLHDCLVTWEGGGGGASCPLQRHHWHSGQLCALQRLDLQQLHCGPGLEPLLAAALPQLRALTALILRGLGGAGCHEARLLAALGASLGGMTRLRELRLALPQLTAATLAAAAPGCLTLLEAEGAHQLQLCAAAAPPPGLLPAALAGLRELSIEGARSFEPALLAAMPALRRLRLRTTSSRWRPDGVAGTHALLAALLRLTELEVLDIRNALQHYLQEEARAPPPAAAAAGGPPQLAPVRAYAALTCSSRLTSLCLSGCQFPSGCFPLLFNPRVALPHLQQLLLYKLGDPLGSPLRPLDAARIVACCPALCSLSLCCPRGGGDSSGGGGGGGARHAGPADDGAGLDALTGLALLTCLTLAGPCVDDALAAGTLAQLAALRSLQLCRCPRLTAAGLRALLPLRQLTCLLVESSGIGEGLSNAPDRLELEGLPGSPVAAPAQASEAQAAPWTSRANPVCVQLAALFARASVSVTPDQAVFAELI